MLRRLAFTTALALTSAPVFAATYTFDATHTQVVFRWNHFGFSNPSAQFRTVNGTLHFDPAHPTQASVEVTIPLATVNSNVTKLDEHLQRDEFFDSAKYPTATFKSTKVEQGAAADKLVVTGDLDFRGVTKPIVLEVTLNKVGKYPMRNVDAVGFDATTTIKRSEFGITKYVPSVSDDIEVFITCEAIEGDGTKPATMKKPG